MGRRLLSIFFLMILAFALSGCLAGPSPLRRKVDDLRNRNYEKNPLATSFFSSVLPIYGLMKASGSFVDVLVINPVQFWGHDVWRDSGTAYTHQNPEGVVKIWPWMHSEPSDESAESYSGRP